MTTPNFALSSLPGNRARSVASGLALALFLPLLVGCGGQPLEEVVPSEFHAWAVDQVDSEGWSLQALTTIASGSLEGRELFAVHSGISKNRRTKDAVEFEYQVDFDQSRPDELFGAKKVHYVILSASPSPSSIPHVSPERFQVFKEAKILKTGALSPTGGTFVGQFRIPCPEGAEKDLWISAMVEADPGFFEVLAPLPVFRKPNE